MFHNIKDLKTTDITKAYIMFEKECMDMRDVNMLFVL